MNRRSWSSQQPGPIHLTDDPPKDSPKRKVPPVPKAALEEGILQLLASAAEMQQRQDLDSALQLYQAAMEKVKEHGLDRKRLFTGTKKKPPPLNVKTPLEWCLHVGDIPSAICLLGNANAALAELRTTVSFERLEQLLDAGANIEHRIGPCGRALLLAEAAEGGQAGVRAALDHGASVTCMDNNGDTALALALANGQFQAGPIVADLLEAGANLNTRNGQGQPLFKVALANAQPEVVAQIITSLFPLTAEHREDIQTWAADMPVHDKTWSDRTCQVITLLLDHGLNPNLHFQNLRYQGKGTSSLLELAIQRQADVLVVALLKHGAAPNLDTTLLTGTLPTIDIILSKLTPLTNTHHQQISAWIKTLHARPNNWPERDREVLKMLLDFGLDPNLRRFAPPHSPLIMCAASCGDNTLLQNLIAHKAKLDVKDDEGNTPLMCAAQNNHREVYDALKATGLNDSYFLFGTVWGTYCSH